MVAKFKPKEPKKSGGIKRLFDNADKQSQERYSSELKSAKGAAAATGQAKDESHVSEDGVDQRKVTSTVKNTQEDIARKKAGDEAIKRGVQDVQTRKSSGVYNASPAVTGAVDKKQMRKLSPIKGIKKSDAKGSVKKSMIRRMKISGQ